jgi:hypothetical protein
MNKYLYLYSGLAHDPKKDAAESAAQMAAWGRYFGGLGDALVEGGAPFMPGSGCVGPTRVTGATGFSIIQATSLADAVALTSGHPYLAGGGSIEVLEFMKLPGM